MAVGAVSARQLPLTNITIGRQVLIAGSATVVLPTITDNSLIFVSGNDANVDGILQTVTTSGTGFVITSSQAGDVGFVAWFVIIIP